MDQYDYLAGKVDAVGQVCDDGCGCNYPSTPATGATCSYIFLGLARHALLNLKVATISVSSIVITLHVRSVFLLRRSLRSQIRAAEESRLLLHTVYYEHDQSYYVGRRDQ